MQWFNIDNIVLLQLVIGTENKSYHKLKKVDIYKLKYSQHASHFWKQSVALQASKSREHYSIRAQLTCRLLTAAAD